MFVEEYQSLMEIHLFVSGPKFFMGLLLVIAIKSSSLVAFFFNSIDLYLLEYPW